MDRTAVLVFARLILASTFVLVPICAEDIRLQQEIVPTAYSIKLSPSFEDGTFQGLVSIDFENSGFYNNISLHEKGLTLEKYKLKRKNYGSFDDVPIIGFATNESKETVTFLLSEQLYIGSYNLEITYKGDIREDATGFYKSYYNVNGKKKWIATTQFEPTYARKAFPCFDEPHFRTTFTLDISLPLGYEAISNVKSTKTSTNTLFIFHFENYPSMPTYLLAWTVFDRYDFVSSDVNVANETEFRVWSQVDYINQTSYANEIGPQLLSALSNFVGVPYTLNKMDQAAIQDFEAGAMENWGLVTYREHRLLYQENVSTTEDLNDITMVIAHEFTHQWFGDLVTLEWWSYTWLNEAFARYFQYYILNQVYPDWKVDDQFIARVYHPAMSYDSEQQHAMTSSINKKSDIAAMFDIITYNKGASIVRMMEHILTKDGFQTGLSRYIKGLSARQVSTPTDLFKILSTIQTPQLSPGIDFQKVMTTWTENPGHPLVTVKRNYTSKTVEVTQERFLIDGTQGNQTWYIPLTYTTSEEANFTKTTISSWLTPDVNVSTIAINASDESWIIFNVQQKDFYRVNYDISNWNLLIKQLRTDLTKIGTMNRAQLIEDSFTLAQNETLYYNTALELSTYLYKETEYVPWIAAIRKFQFLFKHFQDSDINDQLNMYVLNLIETVLRNVSYTESPNEEHLQKLKRMSILSFAAKLGHQKTLNVSKEILQSLVSGVKSNYSSDVQNALLCASLKDASYDQWKSIFDLYVNSRYPTQKIVYMSAITCTQNSNFTKMILDNILNDTSDFRRQDTKRIFNDISRTKFGANELLYYVINNYQDLITYNFNDTSIISSIISGLSDLVYTKQQLQDIVNFTMTAPLSNSTMLKLNKTAGKIQKNFNWRLETHLSIKGWLVYELNKSTDAPPHQSTSSTSSTTQAATTVVTGTTPHSFASVTVVNVTLLISTLIISFTFL